MIARIQSLICRLLHGSADDMWPSHGTVRCRVCHTVRPVAWDVAEGE